MLAFKSEWTQTQKADSEIRDCKSKIRTMDSERVSKLWSASEKIVKIVPESNEIKQKR